MKRRVALGGVVVLSVSTAAWLARSQDDPGELSCAAARECAAVVRNVADSPSDGARNAGLAALADAIAKLVPATDQACASLLADTVRNIAAFCTVLRGSLAAAEPFSSMHRCGEDFRESVAQVLAANTRRATEAVRTEVPWLRSFDSGSGIAFQYFAAEPQNALHFVVANAEPYRVDQVRIRRADVSHDVPVAVVEESPARAAVLASALDPGRYTLAVQLEFSSFWQRLLRRWHTPPKVTAEFLVTEERQVALNWNAESLCESQQTEPESVESEWFFPKNDCHRSFRPREQRKDLERESETTPELRKQWWSDINGDCKKPDVEARHCEMSPAPKLVPKQGSKTKWVAVFNAWCPPRGGVKSLQPLEPDSEPRWGDSTGSSPDPRVNSGVPERDAPCSGREIQPRKLCARVRWSKTVWLPGKQRGGIHTLSPRFPTEVALGRLDAAPCYKDAPNYRWAITATLTGSSAKHPAPVLGEEPLPELEVSSDQASATKNTPMPAGLGLSWNNHTLSLVRDPAYAWGCP